MPPSSQLNIVLVIRNINTVHIHAIFQLEFIPFPGQATNAP